MASPELEQAAEAVNALTEDPGNDMKLKLYGLYKQATVGDATGSRPSFMDFVGRAKYDAWAERKGMSTSDAEAAYLAEAKRLTD